MAEVGLVASVVQLAGFGLKLSISLYAFAESVSSADKDIKHIGRSSPSLFLPLSACFVRVLGHVLSPCMDRR